MFFYLKINVFNIYDLILSSAIFIFVFVFIRFIYYS